MFLSAIHRWSIIVLLCGVIVFLILRPNDFFGSLSDEGYYFHYAVLVKNHGAAAFHQLLRWYGSSDQARLHPSPMRIGYILILTVLFKLFGSRYIMIEFCSLGSFILLLWACLRYSRKHFGFDFSLVYTLILASSPLLLGLSRRALSDSPMDLCWGLAVWMFLDYITKPRRKTYVILMLWLALSVTIKESIVVPMAFFVFIAVLLKHQGAAVSWLDIAGIVFWPLAANFVLYCFILGGPAGIYGALGDLWKSYLGSNKANPYATTYCDGPWFAFLLDFLLMNPVVTLLAVSWAVYAATRRELLTAKIDYFLSYFIFVYGFYSLFPYKKLVRFVVNLEMVLALFAVFMLMEIFKPQESKQGQARFMAAVMGVVALNWQGFLQVFYRPDLLDPITYHLLVFRHLVPAN